MNYSPKPGRSTKAPTPVAGVETLPCGTGTHRLTNVTVDREAVTVCAACGRTWAELDAETRGAA